MNEFGLTSKSGLEKTPGFKKKQLVFLGFIGFFRSHYVSLYYCDFKLFLTRKKKNNCSANVSSRGFAQASQRVLRLPLSLC